MMSDSDPKETMRKAEEAVAKAFASSSAQGRRLPPKSSRSGSVRTPGSLPREPRSTKQRSFQTPSTPRANPVPGTAEYVKNTTPSGAASVSSSVSPTSSDLDLKNNDNAFHVVANLVLDRLLPKVQPGTSEYTLDPNDRVFFDEMVPSSVRHAFVEAVRFRIQQPKTDRQNTLIAQLTDQCKMLGLDKADQQNILLNSSLAKATVTQTIDGSIVSHIPTSTRSIRGGSVRRGSARGGSVRGGSVRGGSVRGGSSVRPRGRSRDSPRNRSASPMYRPRSLSSSQLSLAEKKEELKNEDAKLQQQQLSQQAEQIRMQAEQIKQMQEAVQMKEQKEKEMKLEQEMRLTEQQEALIQERMLKAQQERLLKQQQEILEREKAAIAQEMSTAINSQSQQTNLLNDPHPPLGVSGFGLDSSGGCAPRSTPDGDLLISPEANLTHTESQARQQIMSEIKEATTLMNESVSVETANFWKAHVEELQNRLSVLNKSEVSNSEQSTSEVVDQLQHQDKVKAHYGEDQNRKTREEYIESNRKMAEEHFSQHSQQIIASNSNTNHPNNTRGMPLADAEPMHIPNATYVEMRTLEGMSKTREQSFTDGGTAPLVDVVAPADLPESYVFEAQIGKKKFLATVPAGGVKRGEMFSCPMRDLDLVEIDVERGQWKDTIFDCAQEGFFHALFCNVLFLPHLALAQIMTRNGLNSTGAPGSKFESRQVVTNMVTFSIFWTAMNALAAFALYIQWTRGYYPSLLEIIGIGVFNGAMAALTVLIATRTRQSIRDKYDLPEVHCHGREDVICATFCMPCTICQLGRHTADYNTYRATCCTATGLPKHVQLRQTTPQAGYIEGGQFELA